MSPKPLVIKKGAYFISDAHYSHFRPELFALIESIYSRTLLPTQLFLFGDIFDALFGNVAKTQEKNKKMIEMINDISLRIELVYLEGNHDFNLRDIFENVQVFPISQQPVECVYEDKKVFIAHGDFCENLGYKIYTKLIRNRYILVALNTINTVFNNIILENLDVYLSKKEDCNEFIGFRKYVANRLQNKYNCDYFIEGHFHQNKIINYNNYTYINLAAFACNQRYFIVESSQEKSFLQENSFK